MKEAREIEAQERRQKQEVEMHKEAERKEREEIERAQLESLRFDLPPDIADEAIAVYKDLSEQHREGALGFPPQLSTLSALRRIACAIEAG